MENGRPVGSRRTLTVARRRIFLDHLAATCSVREAAALAEVHHQSCYHLRRQDETFAAEWRAAMRTGYERIEARLMVAAGAAAEAAERDFDPKLALEVLKGVRDRDMMELRGPRPARGRVTRARPEDTDAAILKGLKALAKRKAR